MRAILLAAVVVLSAVFYGAGFYAAAQVWGFINVCLATMGFGVCTTLLMLAGIKHEVRGVRA
jgi:hypothetical protein